MIKTLCLPTDNKAQILAHCAESFPREACGLLIGHEGRVTKVIASPNLSVTPEKAFEIDPALIIHHQKAIRNQKAPRNQKVSRNQKKYRTGPDKIIGHYHSHPDGQAAPSIRDQQQNYDTALIWVIVSTTKMGAQDINAFATYDGQLVDINISAS